LIYRYFAAIVFLVNFAYQSFVIPSTAESGFEPFSMIFAYDIAAITNSDYIGYF
jgi:hypothetical protein